MSGMGIITRSITIGSIACHFSNDQINWADKISGKGKPRPQESGSTEEQRTTDFLRLFMKNFKVEEGLKW